MANQERFVAALAMGISRRIWLERLGWVLSKAGHLAEAAALLAVMTMFACLPVDWASRLGGFIGRTVGPHLGLSRRAARNLRHAMPENSEAENRRILRGMWDNLCRAMAEYPHLARLAAPGSDRVQIVDGDALVERAAATQPSILFGGHLGNREIGSSTVH